MMNSFLYRGNATLLKRSVALLFVSMFAVVAWAQSFTISHTMTPGTCIADASLKIDVTPTNMPAGTQYQYTLYNLTTGAPGLPVVSADLSYTFRDLTVGTYRVEVLARGTSLAPQVRNNITVTTTYVPTTVALDLVNSLNSYACGTGRIVLTIQNGKGNYEVKIVSGPMRVGEVIPMSKFSKRGSGALATSIIVPNAYVLEGENWLPGNYEIEVKDSDCGYIARYTFPINLITEIDYYGFNSGSVKVDRGCNYHRFGFSNKSLSSDVRKYIEQGRYEIGFLFPGQSESEITWFPDVYDGVFVVSATIDTYKLFQDNRALLREQFGNLTLPMTAILRVKQCPQVEKRIPIYTSINEGIAFDSKGWSFSLDQCDSLIVEYGFKYINPPLCFPITLKAYNLEGTTRTLIATGQQHRIDVLPTVDILTVIPDLLQRPHPGNRILNKIEVEATDVNGNILKDTTSILSGKSIYTERDTCGMSYTALAALEITVGRTQYHICNFKIEVYDNLNRLVTTVGVGEGTPTQARRLKIPNLKYGVRYKLVFVNPNTGQKITEEILEQSKVDVLNRFKPEVQPNLSKENYGRLALTLTGWIGAGSVLTVTSPSGEIVYNKTYETTTNLTNNTALILHESVLEPGRYKYFLRNTCDGKDTTAYLDVGLYHVRDFKYTLNYDCGVARLTPSAQVFLGDNQLPSSDYAFYVHPYDNRVEDKLIREGESLLISGEGNYVVSVVITTQFSHWTYRNYTEYLNYPDLQDWRLVDFPMSYVTPSLNIDTERSMTYVCGTSSLGTILLTAKGGVAPYTYELYRTEADRDAGTNVLATQTGVDVRFDYGRMGDDYYVLVKDKCGSRFKHTVHLINITDLSAAYALPNRVCTGDPIQLRLIGPQTLKEASEVKWYRPNGVLLSNTPDIDIPDATAAHSGRYRAEFKLTGCDVGVVNYVDVVVDAPISVTSTPKTETVCVGKPVTLVGSTAPSGTTIYWELASSRKYDPLGVLLGKPYQYSWEGQRLVGNTNESTHRAVFVRAGVYVVRPVYTNGGCFAEGAPITVNVKACTVPVNPHLMHRPIIDWSRFNSTPTTTI